MTSTYSIYVITNRHYMYMHQFVLSLSVLCSDAGAWTEDEAYKIYREKLVRLRDLYVGQLGHLKHVLHGKRREFLQRWQHEGGASMQGATLRFIA